MKTNWIAYLCAGMLATSCAPDVKIFATQAPELPIDQIKTLVVEPFVDQIGARLSGPSRSGGLKSNQGLAQLLQAEVLKGIASGGSYRIVPGLQVQGKPLNLTETGILRATVRYYELNQPGADSVFFVLLAKKKGLDGLSGLVVSAGAMGIEKIAEANGKGFRVPVPYTEAAGALEVDFDLIRASDQKPMIPTQTVTAYWHQKWGGNPELTVLSPSLAKGFEQKGIAHLGILDQADVLSQRLALKQSDPEGFFARGYHLKQDAMVPLNSLAIRSLLARQVAGQFTKKVARHEVEFKLNLASGDGAASNLIKGGAFDAAIDRLESLPTPLAAGDLYNLGVAYEAMGERFMAKRQFNRGLQADPGNTLFKDALKRL